MKNSPQPAKRSFDGVGGSFVEKAPRFMATPGAYNNGSRTGSAREASRATDKTIHKTSCRSDLHVCLLFAVALVFLLSLGFIFDGDDFIPADLTILDLDTNVTAEDVSAGDRAFFDITIPPRVPVAIFVSDTVNEGEGVVVDTTMTMLKRPNDIIEFNDDTALANVNPIIYFFLDQDEPEDFVIQIDVLDNFGNYTLNFKSIEEEIEPNVSLSEYIDENELFLILLNNITVGRTYDIVAYQNPVIANYYYKYGEFNTEKEADTAIRIRHLNGTEIIEVFQGTLAEFTAKVLFTPPSEGPFILEVKGFDGLANDIILLAREITVETIDLETFDNSATFPLHSKISTTLEIDIEAGNKYDFELFLDIDEDFRENFKNNFGYTYFESPYKFLDTYTQFLIEGITMRIYDKFKNVIIQRERSELDVVNVTDVVPYKDEYGNITYYYYNFATFESAEDSTKFTVEAIESTTILLDISRWDLDIDFYIEDEYYYPLDDSLFGFFFLNITESDFKLVDNSDQVDSTNLFPECDIDDAKYTIDDDTCEQGIALYCRNQFAPSNNLSQASLEDFSRICDCATLLCATLQSGNDLDLALKVIFTLFYVVFIGVGFLGMIMYLAAHFELFVCGGFNYWVTHNKGFSTWTLIFLFFLTTVSFYISELVLAGEIQAMQDISDNFNLSSVPIPSEEFTYKYYYALRESIIGGGFYGGELYAYNEQGDFLEGRAADIANNNARPFETLELIIRLNLFCSVLKDVLAIVVFLDVSTVWISATSAKKMNQVQAERQEKRFKLRIRFVEVSYLILLLILLAGVVATNGDTYNFAPNILTLLTSLLVMVVYFYSRQRVAKRFAESQILTEQRNEKLWLTVRNVSSVVIIANAGVILVQIYSIVKVQNFDDLIASSNDPVAQILFVFQDFCMFMGIGAILIYVWKQYMTFRSSLFVEPEEFESTYQTDNQATSINTKTKKKKIRSQAPSSDYYTSAFG